MVLEAGKFKSLVLALVGHLMRDFLIHSDMVEGST
jgi:hypothetical protein